MSLLVRGRGPRQAMESKRFHHPSVTDLTLRINAFDVRSAPAQELIVYHAEAGSGGAEALALLGTLAATQAQSSNPPRAHRCPR